MNCITCGKENPAWAWTDTHGIAQCFICGTPYRLYHYEGEEDNRHRVEKPPEPCVALEYVSALQAYWEENHRKIPSGCSFPGGQELASAEDSRLFFDWLRKHGPKSKQPA